MLHSSLIIWPFNYENLQKYENLDPEQGQKYEDRVQKI